MSCAEPMSATSAPRAMAVRHHFRGKGSKSPALANWVKACITGISPATISNTPTTWATRHAVLQPAISQWVISQGMRPIKVPGLPQRTPPCRLRLLTRACSVHLPRIGRRAQSKPSSPHLDARGGAYGSGSRLNRTMSRHQVLSASRNPNLSASASSRSLCTLMRSGSGSC
jgi:hypothetical protein